MTTTSKTAHARTNTTATMTDFSSPSSDDTAHGQLKRKIPSPPKLNLNDCKPIVTTTTTNTSTNSSSNASTAFVFTSSRSIRTLHGTSQSLAEGNKEFVSSGDKPSSQPPPSRSPAYRRRSRPVLSSAQLARHSVGALDARCIVSSNMRAAGFVPLNTPLHQPTGLSHPSTPTASPVPTPMDPPRFPPIVFVNPSHVTVTPMWDYQRTLAYGLGSSPERSFRDAAVSTFNPPGPSPGPPASTSPEVSSSNMSSLTSTSPVTSSISSKPSTPSIFSRHSSPETPLTSLGSLSLSSFPIRSVHSLDLRDHVDGYPFPHTPPRSQNTSRSRVPIAVSTTIQSPLIHSASSPTVTSAAGSTASGSATPLAGSHSASPNTLPQHWDEPTPVFATRPEPRPIQKHKTKGKVGFIPEDASSGGRLSFTELCSTSPRAWSTEAPLVNQWAPISSKTPPRREPVRGRSRANSDQGVAANTSGQNSDETLVEVDKGAVEVRDERPDEAIEEVKASPELAPDSKLVPDVELEEFDQVGEEKEKLHEAEKHRGREKHRERANEKREKDRRRHNKAKKSSSNSGSSSPTSPNHERHWRKQKHATREGVFSSHSPQDQHGFSSFILPPKGAAPPHAHILGANDPIMEAERQREAGQFAKDQVLAHRERDREYARQQAEGESQSIGIKRPVVHGFPATYGTSHGRGRGVGRGERGHERGRSISSNLRSVISSIFEGSDVETMVGFDIAETFEPNVA